MGEKIKNYTALKLIVPFMFLSGMAVTSYVFFTSYQPKILKKIEEVKGIKKISTIELLYPDNAEIISVSQTKRGSQTSYKTEKSQDYIQVFYKNVLIDLGWEEQFIKKTDESMTYKFKKDEKKATIMTQKELGKTLVGVELTN